jgi:hypothetical protein
MSAFRFGTCEFGRTVMGGMQILRGWGCYILQAGATGVAKARLCLRNSAAGRALTHQRGATGRAEACFVTIFVIAVVALNRHDGFSVITAVTN